MKIHIYFIPGLAANSKIFEYLTFPKEQFELYFLEWILPLAENETISNYAQRMAENIKHKKPVLIGVSFGGIIAQEMAKFIDTQKVIIISSIKSNQELPKRLKLVQITKAYKLFPTKVIENLEDYTKYFLGDFLKKRANTYKKYLSIRNPLYLNWAIYNVLHWQQKTPLSKIIHIHGTEDNVFTIKNIKNCIKIKGGTHIMILTKSKKILKIILKTLIT